jgi:type I restriction enzyme M protein
LLFKVLERFQAIDLHPDKIDNATMGTIFEELIRKFNEALNENPGEHFTPRDVVHLMVDLMLAGDQQALAGTNAIRTVYDPCCGSGGMLTISKAHITEGIKSDDGAVIQDPINPKADIHVFGQELNPETFAICKSDLFMKSRDGRDAEHIAYGSTLSADKHEQRAFDYMITNPPYGKDWKMDEAAVKAEAERGNAGRFGVGLPRISDGQLLFLQHLLAQMKKPSEGGSRIAIIMNGSPLFTGGAGSGESEIRRWVLENDWLEALVALPEQLFYNTGIATYVWVLSNRKAQERRGKVLLIDATSFWIPMRKSLGDKRREIPHDKAQEILELLKAFEEGEFSKIFPTTQFGYRRITVERPLQLNYQASSERIERLKAERAFAKLAASKKRNAEVKAQEEELGRRQQEKILAMLGDLPDALFKDRPSFEKALKQAATEHDIKLDASLKKAILNALCERDETAGICRDKKGNPESDSNLRDTENVPLSESVDAFFEREVKPHLPLAWIDESKRDEKDGGVGIVGYEINFNRYFYTYEPPRPLEEIEVDIKRIEGEILDMLREVAG